MAWIQLILAGFAEVTGVTLLKLSDGFRNKFYMVLMFIAGGVNFYLLSKAIETLPISTAYGVWTGIGSLGTVLIGMIFFRDSKEWTRLLFMSCIIIGIVGLKMTTA
ncbi:QacE family quaternary ammonium compound efflux SMR transporter [Pontibacillus yanchengensis]|uniref:QacE family quaternary ammonium compound efflux SMR transporter n=2 Tax=Pontibacillus yanchengensis TaxID=462910 RepID=A0ACC7VKN4_9BACI|nr:multidrug efflux SMR transporter [Pontibacillus yanchengensis]MYL34637.1 QacE family quaternary ammonium compound efflux SMR transporter [Pontibacillus yanchengensis]MYL54504.1 QacE family quaternary ammonium compound efflux SMR transporter [Pontibacillus yanchengensis]